MGEVAKVEKKPLDLDLLNKMKKMPGGLVIIPLHGYPKIPRLPFRELRDFLSPKIRL